MAYQVTNKKFETREEADNYNKENRRARECVGSGCLSTFCCDNCFTIIRDSVCCCIAACGGGYTCPACGFEKENYKADIPISDFTNFPMDTGVFIGALSAPLREPVFDRGDMKGIFVTQEVYKEILEWGTEGIE